MTDRRKARTWAEIDLGGHGTQLPGPKGLEPRRAAGFWGWSRRMPMAMGRFQWPKSSRSWERICWRWPGAAEGEELRRGGIVLPILCLGQTDPALAQDLLDWNITQTVEDLESAQALSRVALAAGKRLRVHLKVDTGMGRLGFLWGDGENGSALEKMTALCALPGAGGGGDVHPLRRCG